MARYAAEQIYAFARKAGFSPDQAATMTAVSLAESSGNSRAHNPQGEDSRGLWQINARAHPDLARRFDLFDPAQNAQAAFAVSRQGSDISPWTVTHGGASARYLRHRDAAQAAAVSYGDGSGRGSWTGTGGYGSTVSAGAATSTLAATGAGTSAPDTGGQALSADSTTQRFLSAAQRQADDRYVFGIEARKDDADPDAFDCSELVEWAAAQAGVEVPDGASAQYLWLKEQRLLIPPEEAARTPGALLFSFSTEPRPGGGRPSSAHVAISLGDGTTIEARGRRYGVGTWDVGDRFTYAAVIPGISDAATLAAAGQLDLTAGAATQTAAATAALTVEPLLDLGGADTDGDGLTDRKEQVSGLDPLSADTDADRLPDGWELTRGSDARRADADGDLLPDNFEFAQGLDPLDPDTDDDGHLDGALEETWADTDEDGVDDPLERLLGLDPLLADSDSDGFVDGLEHGAGTDATDPLSVPVPSAADLLADDTAL